MVREGVFTHFSWNAECLVTFLVVKSSCSCLVSDIVTERPFLCFDLSQSWSGLVLILLVFYKSCLSSVGNVMANMSAVNSLAIV